MSGYLVMPGTNLVFDKYTYGTALLMLPFFLICFIIDHIVGPPGNGFNAIYDIGVMLSAVFYLVLGMFFLVKTLAKSFKPIVVILALLGMYAGTNLYFYTIRDPAYSHVYSFFLFSLFIYLTPAFIKDTTWKKTLLMSLVFGLIFLVRPTNGVVIFYLLLYDVYTRKDLINRFYWIKQHFLQLSVFFAACVLLSFPQLLYWHSVLGKWQFNGYQNESFIYWNKPKILHVLFGVQNGMLIYAPIAFFSIIGLFIAAYRKMISAYAILLILGFSTYLFASWWCWWYGGAFGHRGYIEYFAFLAIPNAYVISLILNQKPLNKVLVLALFLICIVYTMLLTYAYAWPWEGAGWTWKTYGYTVMKVFGLAP